MGKDEEMNVEGNSRRDFLKKAGVAAWTVPAVQVVNMTGALAGSVNASVTTTTGPPTTPPPPPCRDEVCYRIKWEVDEQGWDVGTGRNDCIENGDCENADGGLFATASGDEEKVTVTIKDGVDCRIVEVGQKAGQNCEGGWIAADGKSAEFTQIDKGISHVELILVCCEDNPE